MVIIGSIPMAYFGYDLSLVWKGSGTVYAREVFGDPHLLFILAVFSLCVSATAFFLFKEK